MVTGLADLGKPNCKLALGKGWRQWDCTAEPQRALSTWQILELEVKVGLKVGLTEYQQQTIFRSSPQYSALSSCPAPTQTEAGCLFLLEDKTEAVWTGENQAHLRKEYHTENRGRE